MNYYNNLNNQNKDNDVQAIIDAEIVDAEIVDAENVNANNYVYVTKNTNKKPIQKIPWSIAIIIAANIIAFIMCLGHDNYFTVGGLNYEYVTIKHQYGRFFSYMFIHRDFDHIFCNMIVLFVFGKDLEKRFGSLKTVVIYILSGIGSGIISMNINHIFDSGRMRFSAGASGAVFGITCASLISVLDDDNDNDKKSKKIYAAVVTGIMIAYALLTSKSGVDIWAHIGGAIVGGIVSLIMILTKWCDLKEKSFAKALGIITTIIFCIVGISEANIGGSNVALPDERIDVMKEMTVSIDNDKNVNISEKLEAYCYKSEWVAFSSSSGEDVVEFNGSAYFGGNDTEIKIQFIISVEKKTFIVCYFEINGKAASDEEYSRFWDQVLK